MQISDAMRLTADTCAQKHYSINTQKSYTHWVRRYAVFLRGQTFKSEPAEQKMEAFLKYLSSTGIAAPTQNQAFNALLFFYRDVLKQELGAVDALRATRPETIRECPSVENVTRLLAAVQDVHGYPTRLIVHVLYACGLRVTEPLNLRVKDIDLRRSRFHVHKAKGGKGRVVPFPGCLSEPLTNQLAEAKAQAEADRAKKVPVPLPDALEKKWPNAGRSERWAWLFPARNTCRHPRTGKEVRWRCHEANVQRAVKQATRHCNLEGITPHHLRHAFASHSLQNGVFVRDLQVVLGHKSLETTMRYIHAEVERVTSPLREFVADPGKP